MLANYSTDQKNFSGHMFNIKLEEKSYKLSFKALPVKIQRSKNRQRRGAMFALFYKNKKKQIFLSACRNYWGIRFTTTIYRKPIFSGTCIDFEQLLAPAQKFGMVYTLVYRRFHICSDWVKFHFQI